MLPKAYFTLVEFKNRIYSLDFRQKNLSAKQDRFFV